MKDFEITEKNYLYLLRYFDGDVKNLNMDDLKNLNKIEEIELSNDQITKICDRDYIGCDQLIILKKNQNNWIHKY